MSAPVTRPADNVLDYMDQSFFLDFTAQHHGPPLIQFLWVYEHDVDLAALRRMHASLSGGLLGRCVERSPLGFGRDRWVRWSPPTDLEVAERPRPRSEITAWNDEQAARPIDYENGPPWRMAVQPLTEGGAAVTLVVAHGIADGMAMNLAVADAVNGVTRDLGYPRPHSRSRATALRQDARQLLRDLPGILSALVRTPLAATKVSSIVRRRAVQGELVRPDRPGRSVAPARVRLPSVTGFVDAAHWDQRAAELHGTSNPLLLGVAARLCGALGWVDTDGMACLTIPVNERVPFDTRGNALTGVSLDLDPALDATDLTEIRAEVKAALRTLSDQRSAVTASLPLTPFVPGFAARGFEKTLFRSANLTVSHMGDLDPAVNRPDGTEAEWFSARHARWADGIDAGLLARAGGMFFPVASGRVGGRLYVSICYSDAYGTTTEEDLRTALQSAFADFGVSGTIV